MRGHTVLILCVWLGSLSLASSRPSRGPAYDVLPTVDTELLPRLVTRKAALDMGVQRTEHVVSPGHSTRSCVAWGSLQPLGFSFLRKMGWLSRRGRVPVADLTRLCAWGAKLKPDEV